MSGAVSQRHQRASDDEQVRRLEQLLQKPARGSTDTGDDGHIAGPFSREHRPRVSSTTKDTAETEDGAAAAAEGQSQAYSSRAACLDINGFCTNIRH